MKKFNRKIHKTMGSLPPQLFKYIDGADIKSATIQFNEFINRIATDFHAQLEHWSYRDNIKLSAPNLFGQPVKLKYIASGSIGSVYKLEIGSEIFALKINRNASYNGELDVIPMQKRAKGLLNRAYMGAVFEYNNRKYSWVLSDFVEHDTARSFEDAMIKMYFAYLTKGIIVRDTHPGNIKGGKIIDIPSFDMRDGAIDDIKKLNLRQVDIVKKLVNFIKTDNMADFEKMVNRVKVSDPIIIQYMFFAMKFGRAPALSINAKEFFAKIKRYEVVINAAKKDLSVQHISESNVR
ncbi:MAG: hypothetical protein J6J82_03515 [Alphaproteobacteria bacterium]|nr:hypothetical protein [Alphaproteobacteria bacterium]